MRNDLRVGRPVVCAEEAAQMTVTIDTSWPGDTARATALRLADLRDNYDGKWGSKFTLPYSEPLLADRFIDAYAEMLVTTPGWTLLGPVQFEMQALLRKELADWLGPMILQFRQDDEYGDEHIALARAQMTGGWFDVWASIRCEAGWADPVSAAPYDPALIRERFPVEEQMQRVIDVLSVCRPDPRAQRRMSQSVAQIKTTPTLMPAIGLAVHLARRRSLPLRWSLAQIEEATFRPDLVAYTTFHVLTKENLL